MGIQAGATGLVGLLVLTLGACVSADDESYDDIDVGFRSSTTGGKCIPTRPGSPGGGGDWIANGLDDVNLSGIDTDHGLMTPQGMAEVGGLIALEDMRTTAEYLVECALPEGDSITKVVDGQTLVFDGALGLAPEWKDGACDVDCQQWVSACMLARTNTSGEHVDIWIAAEHPGIGLGKSPEFPLYEATFYGNLFEEAGDQFLCKGKKAGIEAGVALGRTCSSADPEACGFEAYKKCKKNHRCDKVGTGPNKFYVNCAEGSPNSGPRYNSVSVYLRDPAP